ncbi:uncharacterized protein LOC119066599 isoform X5 [Bradysia coprophila]|uniref:uncharacterized protein LOC119066599 isoform X5 n=1 Tax=Bradysia coprophila TaxID=38358 RepID=UPI00187D8CB3|nr:uncharacterized protein LOC119066599 isoform X5 [Bradysia coprophila]
MSTNRNKSTGLTFLWIPGKKKHQHKGRYDTTNKGNMHPSHQQKKMEPWSLGGSKAHADMIKTDDILGESSGLTSMVPSSIGAAGASANLDSIERFDDHNSDDVDATKLSYLDLPKVPFHGGDGVSGTDQVRHSDKGTKKNDEDDCTVKCLYYTLMCCECTIS